MLNLSDLTIMMYTDPPTSVAIITGNKPILTLTRVSIDHQKEEWCIGGSEIVYKIGEARPILRTENERRGAIIGVYRREEIEKMEIDRENALSRQAK